jgi:hypothetical protein
VQAPARLWVSRCRLLKRRSSIVGGRSIFSNLQHPPENKMIRGAQAAEEGLQAAGAWATLGKQMPALEAPVLHRRWESDFFQT